MLSRKLLPWILLLLFIVLFVGVRSAAADSGHARIVRLSLVQGDVRFARQTHGDPLADSNAVWETAELNLPIEHGYVVATDNGRAEVEFENGAMAFLKENTVLQFYDLSLKDGMFTTRLVVIQGSASFYVNPARGDYFSVTGGDFTVEANGRCSFRLDNYDNGSPRTLGPWQTKTTSTAGSPAGSTPSRRPRTRPSNTPALLITRLDLPTSIPMAPGPTAADTAMAGGLLARA